MDSVRDFKEIIKENKKMLYKLNQFGQIEISFDKLYEVKELLQLMNELLKIVNINNVVKYLHKPLVCAIIHWIN